MIKRQKLKCVLQMLNEDSFFSSKVIKDLEEFKKVSDVSKLNSLGWKHKVELEDGNYGNKMKCQK